jgi:hypothetical protein
MHPACAVEDCGAEISFKTAEMNEYAGGNTELILGAL